MRAGGPSVSRTGLAGAALLVATHVSILTLGFAHPALAFAPQAAAAIAERIPGVLPPAARWNPSWGEAAADAVIDRVLEEDQIPEAMMPWHRFTVGGPVFTRDGGEAAMGAGTIMGLAPHRLALVSLELRDAFREGDDARITQSIADLAMTAADLADPFHVTSLDREETETARARFSDLLAPDDVSELSPAEGDVPPEAIAAAVQLADESARERDAIEAAVRAGDRTALQAIRRGRLEAALVMARAIALSAWHAAGAPVVPYQGAALGAVHVEPNPARAQASLSFVLRRPGVAALELFDALGRRVWTHSLGPRAAGQQGAVFTGGVLETLPAGVYLVRIATVGEQTTGRLVHVR